MRKQLMKTNERIEQLAEQVDLLGDFIPTKISGRYAGTISITDIKQFAELIVQECAAVASQAENNDRELRCMHDVITEHFGIKQ